MNHITAVFQIYWPVWIFWMAVWIGGGSLSVSANEWQLQIKATDSHLAYIGGERYIFLDILDENENHLGNLSNEHISFKVNQKPHLLSDFYYQHQQLEQRIALLVGMEKTLDSQELETIKKGFHQFILQKKDSDEILINFNGSGQEGTVLKVRDDLEMRLQNINSAPDKSIPIADFLFKQLQSFRSPGKRQWVILLVPNTNTASAKIERENLVELLVNHHITLIPIIVGKPDSDHWLKVSAMQTGGSIYHVTAFEDLPALLQKMGKKIQQEYALTYRFNALGNIPHEVEIKFIANHGLETIRYQEKSMPIWAHPQKPIPLAGIAFIGGLTITVWGFILVKKWKASPALKQRGFQIMTPGENFQFIPLKEDSYTLDFLTSIKMKGNLRLSANLDKVVLTTEQNSYFLEDKNYKNALLINRRRVRRILLRHGDILDIGELTVIYLNHVPSPPLEKGVSEQASVPIYFDKPQGPIRKKIGVLIDEATRQEYYLVKNITFIGRSKTNNIVLNSPQIALRHAKIVRIGVQYKLQSLNNQEGSFVNRRRVEQRFLKDGDEISFDVCRLRFRVVNNPQARAEKTRGASVRHA